MLDPWLIIQSIIIILILVGIGVAWRFIQTARQIYQLNRKAFKNLKFNKFELAEELLQRAENLAQTNIKCYHSLYGETLLVKGMLFQYLGQLEEALKLYRECLAIKEATFEKRTQGYATTLHNIAQIKQLQGQLEEALTLYRESLAITEATVGKQTESYATTLHDIAQIKQHQGKLEEALTRYHESLVIKEATIGRQTESYATTLHDIAGIKQLQGKLEEALTLYHESLAIKEATVGKQTQSHVTTLHNIAEIKRDQGQLEEALTLLCESLAITEATVGKQTQNYAITLTCIAQIKQDQGQLEEALTRYHESLAITEARVGRQTEPYATILHCIAKIKQLQGHLEEALTRYRESLAIKEATVGKQTQSYATTLSNIARIKQLQGHLEEALTRYHESLAITEATVGKQTESYATTLDCIASIKQDQGQLEEALTRYRESLAIKEATVGKQTQSYATTLSNIAILKVVMGQIPEAFDHMIEYFPISNSIIDQIFAISEDRVRSDYLQSQYYNLERFLSLVTQHLSHDPEAKKAAFDLVIRRKSLATVTAAAQRVAMLSNRYPHLESQFEQLKQLNYQISKYALNVPDTQEKLAIYQENLAQLYRQRNELESTFSNQIPEMRLEQTLKDLDHRAIALNLPQDATLVEFIRFKQANFTAPYGESKWGEAYYLAFILPQTSDQIEMINLGAAEPIDQMIHQFRSSIGGDGTVRSAQNLNKIPDPKKDQELRDRLFQPLLPHLKPNQTIYIAPDFELNYLNFDILPGIKHKYLQNDYQIINITTARDLIHIKSTQSNSDITPPLLIADPSYNLTSHQSSRSTDPSRSPILAELSRELFAEDSRGDMFHPLPGSNIEGQLVAPLLKATLKSGSDAVKSLITNIISPAILWISTHGYCLQDIQRNKEDSKLLIAGEQDPLMRAGLAFAGVNNVLRGEPVPPEVEEGILTALVAMMLNLSGTALVVLSACQTALGTAQTGETVSGFRRSFIIAGAQSLVVSLWKVNDFATTILMERYCHYLIKERLGRASALTKAQEYVRTLTVGQMRSQWLSDDIISSVRKHTPSYAQKLELLKAYSDEMRPYEQPFYWGAFICIGNPDPLPVEVLRILGEEL